ncbi:ral GTPase-activating protein subunit alpha-1-like [Planoprotostelium fungivorum]|uniref:Ral GTPase-activating protein subunit alpha-1-like n=1 Tax=Planoprotostelium fungivorum TaxID=1890364 RepID=A0A2P6NUH4_9EUKA|nr:ral GTPase-activating protein subunit alpha-1-like [Planoprotostelium fungivorum]
MSSSNSANVKKAKKLQKILKEKIPAVKRYKTLVSYSEMADVTELQKLLSDSTDLVYNIITERWNELETTSKKVKAQAPDVLTFQEFLLRIFPQLPVAAKRKYKEKIHSVLDRCLANGVKGNVRSGALRLLMCVIDNYRDEMDEEAHLFANTINLSTFGPIYTTQTGSTAKFRCKPKDIKEGESICGTAPLELITKEDTLAQITQFLDALEKKDTEDFDFWFTLFKEFYLSTLYPKIFQELKLLSKTDDTGFVLGCPGDIQQLLVDRLEKWSSNSSISHALWDNNNAPILNEISRQTCSVLPINFADTVHKSNMIFYQWLSDSGPRLGARYQKYWQLYLDNVCSVFTRKDKLEDTTYQGLCRKTVNLIISVCNLDSNIDDATWTSFQMSYLKSVHTQFAHCQSKEGSMGGVPDQIFGTLLYAWIKSPATTKMMWSEFQALVSELREWKFIVAVWKEKLVQLSYILKDFIYSTHKHADLYGSMRKASSSVSRDPRLDAIHWSSGRITEVWFIMLEILGDINSIKDGNNHHITMTAIKDVIEIISMAELDTLKFNDMEPIPLMGVFLGVLLDACYNRAPEKIKGRLCSTEVLCDMFTHQSFRPRDIRILSHFYTFIISVLDAEASSKTSEDHSVVLQILSGCRSVFSLELPGSYILIPSMIQQITQLFKKSDTPESTLVECMTIISSIIPVPFHLKEINNFTNWINGSGGSKEEMYRQCFQIIQMGIHHANPNIQKPSICVLTSLLAIMITNNNPLGLEIDQLMEVLLGHKTDLSSIHMTLDAMSTIASFDLSRHPTVIPAMVGKLSSELLMYMNANQVNGEEESVICHHYQAAVDVLLNPAATFILRDEKYNNPLLYVLTRGMEHSNGNIKEAAHSSMLFIMEDYCHYPRPSGVENDNTVPNAWETEDKMTFVYAHNTSNVLVVSLDSRNRCRMVCRNAMGKRGWVSEILPSDVTPSQPVPALEQGTFQQIVPSPPPPHTIDNPLYNLAKQIGKKTLIDLEKEDEGFTAAIESRKRELAEQSKKEETFVSHFSIDPRPQTIYPDGKNKAVLPMQNIRLQLIQWGFVDVSNLDRWIPLHNDTHLHTSLKKFDQLPVRDWIKIGVIYVAEGQEDAKSLLTNNRGSEAFNRFLLTLGWSIDLSQHPGYTAGLESSDAKTSVYWCNSQQEICYHVTTQISGSDPESNVQKRFLIGNDSVEIIWSEHGRDYNPNILPSQFNDVQIVIYPQPSHMFRVQILRKPKVLFFGPLMDEMVVPLETLAVMVRQTAVHANRNVRNLTKGYVRPVNQRFGQLRQIVEKYRDNLPMGDTAAQLFVPPQATSRAASP